MSHTPLVRYLDTNGDGTGTSNANGDYSLAEEIFYIQPEADEIFEISRVLISIEDTSGMQAQEYGNLGSALTNGVVLRMADVNGVQFSLSPAIKTNAGWSALCYDADVKTWGAGNELLAVRYTFSKLGIPLTLQGAAQERFEVVVNDDLSGLISHQFLVQGFSRENN